MVHNFTCTYSSKSVDRMNELSQKYDVIVTAFPIESGQYIYGCGVIPYKGVGVTLLGNPAYSGITATADCLSFAIKRLEEKIRQSHTPADR